MREAVTGAVRSGLADSQYRAGIDLVGSAALNALTGLAFWFVAARTFDEPVVGVNAALISTMAAVANVASLGMKNGLIRFLPGFGSGAAKLVKQTYAAAGLCVLVVAPLVAYVLAERVDELATLDSVRANVAFTAACLVWIIFVLQDSLLVALKRTALIPAANLAHALAKLVALVVLAFSTPYWGIFAAWTVPVLAIVVWINVATFRTLASWEGSPTPAPAKGLVRFAGGEHASMVLNMVLFGALPIYVLAELGETDAAFYALAWTIAYNLMLANSQVSTALLAAATGDLDQLDSQVMKAVKQMALFVVPGALALFAFASLGLRIFGTSYAEGGTTVLRLLALAGIPNIVSSVSISILRAHRQVARLFVLYAIRIALVFGLSLVLVPRYDLAGIGWAWLIGESVLAVGLGATHLRTLLMAGDR